MLYVAKFQKFAQTYAKSHRALHAFSLYARVYSKEFSPHISLKSGVIQRINSQNSQPDSTHHFRRDTQIFDYLCAEKAGKNEIITHRDPCFERTSVAVPTGVRLGDAVTRRVHLHLAYFALDKMAFAGFVCRK